MSYIVFARKWRPQNFDDVIGQDHIVTTLKNAIKSNRIAHAYIFAGPRGVGKTSTARILAKSLNCQKRLSGSPCNKCPSCIEITEARNLDVIEIDGASNRGIDEIRSLRENVKFSPTQGRFKIYIIDEVHMLTTEAFNALLKTLEEPPAHVKFIFATTQPQRILSTITSRCQFLEFRRISTVIIIEKLKSIAKSENITVGEDVLLAIAKASEGSLRDAESILDEMVSFTNGNINIQDVNSVLGVVEQEFLFEITDKVIKKDTSGALTLLDKLIDQGKDPNQLLLDLVGYFRNLMIVKVTSRNHEKLLDLPNSVCEAIEKQSKDISLDEILFGFNVFLNAQEMSRRIDNLRIPLEVAIVKLSSKGKPPEQMKAASGVSGVESRIPDEADNKIENTSKPKDLGRPKDKNCEKAESSFEVDSSVALQEENTIELDKIKELWPSFIEKLSKIKVAAAHYAEKGEPFKVKGEVLTIGFLKKSNFHKESLERKENRAILEKIWKDILQQDIRIDFCLINKDDDGLDSLDKGPTDPFVQSALDTFNGRVIRKELG